ncbi:hypothetical protein BVC80_8947g13 [Macleaya cordata]|uniref:Uncharacterized protein n=1 Tax=Macleaya cordata TaxID=56857 RepID=A0A200QRJ5_MACCD|nr:hypothetical protein BVC80_8947g13 [Macleaya cordata]
MLLHRERQTLRKLSYLISDHHPHEDHKIKVPDTPPDDKGVTGEGDDNEEELVYHVDYHGVSTHPTPTPKHPTP